MLNTPNIFFSTHEIDGTLHIDNYKSKLNIFLTPYSITHFVFGYIAQAFGINYLYGLVIHTIYEYASKYSTYIAKKWSEEWTGFKEDSLFNSVGDTLCFLLGMMLAKNYNNMYLFIFIFLIGFIFYSPYFQYYLTNNRLNYLKSQDNTIELKNTIFKLPKYSYNILFIAWTIISLITFIKLKIKNKNFKF
jgi:hypothetical protein